jgi:uncharacterized Zn-binding protein involved in type VI secretion
VGVIITGSGDHSTNNRSSAYVTSLTNHDCPHCGTGMIISGSSSYFINNLPSSRIGDIVTEFCGTGIIVTGSGDQDIGG